MYYASTHNKKPKRQIPASVVTSDGEMFEGHFYASGDQRLKDLLNGENSFLPFQTLGGAMYILNRQMIARVVPRAEGVQAAGELPQAKVA